MLLRTMPSGLTLGSIIVFVAFGLYAVYQINFLTDPWSSWVHIETPYYDPTLRHAVTMNKWAGYRDVIFAEPIRFRPVMQAVELLDSYLRPAMVATFGFLPSLANASSVVYFAFCPILAVLIARRLVGSTAVDAVLVALAVGVFLTSVGYISASIFVFHPTKKLVILGTLVAFLVFLKYMRAPQPRYLVAIAALQFAMALTDETGLAAGVLFCALVAGYVIAFRRGFIFDLGWLVGSGVATVAAFAYRFGRDWTKLDGAHIYGGEGVLQRLLGSLAGPATNFDVFAGHLAAAFSSLYGFPATKYLFLFGFAGASIIALCGLLPPVRERFFNRPTIGTEDGIAESGFLLLAAVMLLILSITVAVMLVHFGGSLYLSIFNYYYGATLPVFAFFVICSAFRLTAFAAGKHSPLLKLAGWSVRATLGVALILALAANVQNMPRLNRLVAMIHNNPYVYGAINEAGRESLRKARVGSPLPGEVIRIPQCGEATFTREFTELLDQLSAPADIRPAYLYYPSRPFVGERYLVAYFEMMLRRTPAIEVFPGPAGQC